jgi:hypothetical protein
MAKYGVCVIALITGFIFLSINGSVHGQPKAKASVTAWKQVSSSKLIGITKG